jgi:nanoRNase/pAp phosphatase (c-di-AMP/oligoRNAs hydrolase)
LVWATATYADLASTGTTPESFTGLIDELMTSVPDADVVMLITEREPGIISGSVRTALGVNATEIVRLFNGGGHPGAAGFKLSGITLAEALPGILEKVRHYQTERLGLASPQPEKLAPEAQDIPFEA